MPALNPRRRTAALLLLTAVSMATLSACASAPPPPPGPIPVPYPNKIAWVLQLEDRRLLKLPESAPPPPPPVIKGRRPAPPAPVPEAVPDLTKLVTDADARVRRRAAIALGRVGLKEGIAALTPLLADADRDVRQAAAFALGLIGDRSASAALVPLLNDVEPMVRGRAAEALGLMGADETAAEVGKLAAAYAKSPAVAAMGPDDERWPGEGEAEAFKLALFALVRLRGYDALAAAVLEGGHSVSTWWPVAYALQRIADPRGAPALRQLTQVKGRYTPAFAARGLGRVKDTSSVAVLLPLIDTTRQPREVVASAMAAIRDLGAVQAGAQLAAIAADDKAEGTLRLEAVTTIAALKAIDQLPVIQDLMTDDWPALRAAAVRAAAVIDPDNFTLILSGLEIDRHWMGRAALADALAALPSDVALERVTALLKDEDKRVISPALRALVRLRAPDIGEVLIAHLKDPDYVVRETAASLMADVKPADGIGALREAYATAQPDSAYGARAAAVAAMAAYASADAIEGVRAALADKDWAVRVRAAELLAKLDPATDHQSAIRPVPGAPPAPYEDPLLAAPSTSPHVFIETERGTIEVELAVLDAPQTTRNFIELVRKNFFNGLQVHRVVPNFVVQDGDPRGDGEGGPGYTIRDELNERPYLRGTMGMALSWQDTGGSQFFITHSPQPHLDARYTAFGHVVNGMDVVDRMQVGDTIRRVRIWDGKQWIPNP